jgi:2-methylcitrate dehydratase PrpD
LAETIAEFLVNERYEDLPEEAIKKVKEFTLDVIECPVGASDQPQIKAFTERLVREGGNPHASVFAHGFKTSMMNAALFNGNMGHAFDFDNDHREGTMHPCVAVFPPVFAVGEKRGAPNKGFLRFFILGLAVMIRLGESLLGKSYHQGFHPTAPLGMFGVAMTAARSINLTLNQTANALGIENSFVAGNLECYADGSYTKRLHAGSASSTGVTVSLLAKNGYTGPKSILEGPRGFFHAYCKDVRPELLSAADFRTFEIEKVSFKPHACCRFNQAGIDAVLALFSEHGLDRRKITSIRIELARTCYEVVGRPEEVKSHPKNAVDCQFSSPYSVAITAIGKKPFLDEYTDQLASRQDVAELLKKIKVLHNHELDRFFPESVPTRVTIGTNDGKIYSKEVRYPKGDPENPLSEAEVEKFERAVAASGLSETRRKQILESILGLEGTEDVKGFTALLSGL